MTKTELRKLQKSKTGYYLNIPKKVAEELELHGDEFAKITYSKGDNKLVVELVRL